MSQSTKMYTAGRNTFIVFVALSALSFILELVFGCQGECDQNGFEGIGFILIVTPVLIATFAVSIASLLCFVVDRYKPGGSTGRDKKRGVFFIATLLMIYVAVLALGL
jgi:hypothetical protein